MQWGFGWELGPFQIWDALGVREVLDAVGGEAAPAIPHARHRFRENGLPPSAPDLQILKSAKDRQKVVRRNAGASLVDLGDGVLAVEFHSKMNAIGGDTIEMLHAGVKEAAANFAALVVGNDAPNFSAGANLMLLLLEAQEGRMFRPLAFTKTFAMVFASALSITLTTARPEQSPARPVKMATTFFAVRSSAGIVGENTALAARAASSASSVTTWSC